MSIFSKIRNRIIHIFSNLIGEKKEYITYSDIEDDIAEISKQQASERKSVIEKYENSFIYDLSGNQIYLIEKKSETLNIRKSQSDFEMFRQINYEIERLETNIVLQSKIKFIPKKIDNELITLLSVQLIEEKFDRRILEKKSNKRLKFEEERKTDIEKISILKNDILNFSLIKIHQKREEERKEKERIERERIIDEQFKIHIENSRKQQTLNNFEQAEKELLEAIKVKPDKEKEVTRLITEIITKKQEFEKRQSLFNEIFSNAENSFHRGDLEQAIYHYREALKLNIDNLKCERRISDANYKIKKLKELETEKVRKEKEEKEKREKYKDDAESIMNYFKQNGIPEFYHYTDTRNINSILQNGGLFSISEMRRRRINYHPGAATEEQPDYIRLSYTRNHPLLWVSQQQKRIIHAKVFEIDLAVASLRHTKFTNVNVARTSSPPTVIFGDDLSFIKNHVKLDVAKRQFGPSRDDPDHPYYQAEIMVKDHVELKFIKNLKD